MDKLVRVTQRGGAEQWVLIHIDVQGRYDRNFSERMFVYNYRVYDRYRRPVASLAVLADSAKRWRPDTFGYSLFGCEVGWRNNYAESRSNVMPPSGGSLVCCITANGTNNGSLICLA